MITSEVAITKTYTAEEEESQNVTVERTVLRTEHVGITCRLKEVVGGDAKARLQMQ